MDSICLEYDAYDGLRFYKMRSEKKTLLHSVAPETLRQMSLDDLKYCIATNCIGELKSLHEEFRDYLRNSEGDTEPAKKSGGPR